MNGTTKKKRKSSRSLARKLNAELAWRKCFRNLTVSLLLFAAIFIGWCFWNELSAGGGITKTVSRRLVGQVNFFPDGSFAEIAGNALSDAKSVLADLSGLSEGTGFSETAVFRDVRYVFKVMGSEQAERSVDCTALLNVEWWLTALIAVTQFIEAIWRSLAGNRVIRKYLRPIDEIAVMAEKLSSETADRHSSTAEEVRKEEDEKGDLSGDVQNLAVAIDRIDDSGTRIEVHDTELGGLEAALNNMLRRLDESKRSQIRFVDDASHELRTPIAVIQGYAGMLDRWGKEDEKVRDEAIEAIKTEADHMKTLVDQLLFLARGEMDRHVLEMLPVNLYECLDEIVEESVMLDKDHRYILVSDEKPGADPAQTQENGGLPDASGSTECVDFADPAEAAWPDVTVLADAAMLKQCIRIIRDNAAKYTPAGGEITFRAMRRGGEVIVEVQDTGIGIPAEEIPRIFDRFYRGSNARADNAGGSGLGLSIAKWIVDQHGGRIEAVSVPELGTKMKLIFTAAGD